MMWIQFPGKFRTSTTAETTGSREPGASIEDVSNDTRQAADPSTRPGDDWQAYPAARPPQHVSTSTQLQRHRSIER